MSVTIRRVLNFTEGSSRFFRNRLGIVTRWESRVNEVFMAPEEWVDVSNICWAK